MMRYLSVCSGIEAASVAWHGLGWVPVAFSEIDPFASAVLAARFPHVPNLGNMEAYREWPEQSDAIDILVGGTPCQSFSVAGLRKGLEDPRGNLALVYLGILEKYRPRWCVWENVPGVLSSNEGRDFGAFLGGLAQLGYGFSYRVLDAQFIRVESHPRAVPQRRRRVFVVGCAGGDWRSAAAVLLEPEGVRGNCPARRTSREGAAGSFGDGAEQRGEKAVIARQLASGRYTEDDVASTVAARDYKSATDLVATSMAVRRLTPRECERLQGFPDDWTAITYRGKPASDGPRYKALGNSMACNVMRWIGQRIANHEASNA
jgi:DNA (cytosine-5)-methyltransferase 1